MHPKNLALLAAVAATLASCGKPAYEEELACAKLVQEWGTQKSNVSTLRARVGTNHRCYAEVTGNSSFDLVDIATSDLVILYNKDRPLPNNDVSIFKKEVTEFLSK